MDTNNYRNHERARSQIILLNDRIIHEALSHCTDIDGHGRDYYIREMYRKDAISGISLSTAFHDLIDKEVYNLVICCMGVADDIIIRFYDRKKAMNLYSTINKWIFDD